MSPNTVSGTITSSSNSSYNITGANITIGSISYKTDSSGSYILYGVSTGSQSINANATGFQMYFKLPDYRPGVEFRNKLCNDPTRYQLQLHQPVPAFLRVLASNFTPPEHIRMERLRT